MSKPRLDKKKSVNEILGWKEIYIFLLLDFILLGILIIITLFFNICFVEAGMMRNFLIGGV